MKKITFLVLFVALLMPGAMQAQNLVKKDVARNATTQLVKKGAKANAGQAVVIHAPKAIKADVPEGFAQVTLTAPDIWGDGTGYQMLLDADATAYGTIIPTSGALTTSGDVSDDIYAQFEYKIPENADGALTTQNIVFNASVTILIPAGTYDYCITNPTPGNRMWIAGDYGPTPGRADDFVFASGVAYEFTIAMYDSFDGVSLTIDDPSAITIPTDVTAEPTATTADVAWTPGENNDGWNLRYREYVDNVGDALSWGFDESTLDGWTTIDADGDGFGWILGSAVGGVYLVAEGSLADTGHNGSHDLVASASYSNVYGVLTPDNYLVSPKVQLGGKITFWAKGQDADYCAETFGVAVSTTGNTDAADFTMVGTQQTATADWVQYEFDLSAYAGQEGYVAIRHYDISDMFILDVDDIEILQAETSSDWIEHDNVNNPFTIEGLTPETTYEVQVMAFNDSGETDWTESTIFTTLADEEPAVYEEFYVVGTFNDWNQNEDGGRIELVENEDGIFVGQVNLEAGAEFKVITLDASAANGWKWFGGVDDNQVGFFLINEGLLDVNISLIDGSNFRIEEAGEYTITVMEAPTTGLKGINEPLVMVVSKVVTGINDINADKAGSNEWYNLNGQKLNGKPGTAGIYINGGRKVIVK